MSSAIRIGDLARETGRSVHAIRWYEQQGLIPHVVRDGGGRRTYHVEWLRFLERLRFTGMAIREMRAYADLVVAGHRSLGERQTLLARHRMAVAARIGELSAALGLIDEKVAYYREWQENRRRPDWTPKVGASATLEKAPRRIGATAGKRKA